MVFYKKTFKDIFQENNQSAMQFISWSGSMLCLAWSGYKLFPKAISRQQLSRVIYKRVASIHLEYKL